MTTTFIGVAFTNDVIYNVMEDGDYEFNKIGLSIIQFLNKDKNKFISTIVESQSYDQIFDIFKNKAYYGEKLKQPSTNLAQYNEVHKIMESDELFDYYYVFDAVNDMLVVKTPSMIKPLAVDYKCKDDVDYFIDYIKNI